MVRPMLDDLELQQVQTIEVDGDQVWTQHSIPALEGDFFQGLGRRASQMTLVGVLTGAEVADGLKNLRSKFRSATPVSFVADIATATHIDAVLIEEMGVRELAGKPSRFEYAFTLREYIPTTPPKRKIPPTPKKPPVKVLEATLIVEVIVEGQPNFNHDNTIIEVTDLATNNQVKIPNSNRTAENIWEEQDYTPGNYTVKATTAPPNSMTGSEPAQVELGKTEHVRIHLRQGTKIAHYVGIHYWFDKAFIEPCMRPVMRQVAEHLQKNPDKKLLILGHTDLVGGDDYNQSLAERRARGAYAYLTTGTDLNTAVSEWDELRKKRTTGITRTVNDTWGVRQYQLMLFDLGYYAGVIKNKHDTPTDEAVRAFQADNNLSVDGQMGDQSWPILIREYIKRDALTVNPDQLLPNVREDCDGGKVRWLGAGELDPLRDTEDAWRPNRRTEFLFVPDDSFQQDVKIPEPHTLTMPVLKYDKWCLGGKNEIPNCFVKPHPGITRKQQCTQPPDDERWERQPLETDTIVVNGRITYDDGSPYAKKEYVLIAPDGEFMNGERPSGADRGRPINGRTDADGNFTDSSGNIGYPKNPKRSGVFTLELQEAVLARLDGEPLTAAKGPLVCKRLAGNATFKVIVARSSGCQFPGHVHFEFAKSFIRPATKRALRAIADFMGQAAASWRLLPVGHTDLQGSDAINTALGERRAKAVFGFLTGNPPDPANPSRSIWLNLHHDAHENWGAREIQYMLLDLGFYCHHLTSTFDAETNRAISIYKNQAGLGNNSIVDDVFLERLFTDYIAHDGAAVPAHKFLAPINWLSCGKQHPLDIRGGAPFAGRSEINRRVEFIVFTNLPNPAPSSTTDCSQYATWQGFCATRWLEFIGPKRNPVDPADAEENLAFLEVANWQRAFDFDPPDAQRELHPAGDLPRIDFIDRDPDRFFIQITDTSQQGVGSVRAQIKPVNANNNVINQAVEFELQENPDRLGVFRAHDIANGRSNPMLLVADEIDNGEQNNGSAVGAIPFIARGINNGALNDPVHRAALGGAVVIEYAGSELGRIPVGEADCIHTIPVNIVILRNTDGTAVTDEPDIEARVLRLQQAFMQCGVRFDVTISTAAANAMPAGVALSNISGISVTPGGLVDINSLHPEERALFNSPLNIRSAAGGGHTNTLQIFYANHLDGAGGTAISYPRARYSGVAPDHIFNTLMIGADDPEENSTLSHEMMHILLNSAHDPSASLVRTNIFFHRTLGQRTFADTTVTSNKRIPEEQCERIMNNGSGLIPNQPGGTP